MTGIPIEHRGCCRFCDRKLEHVFVDLGMSPLCESFLAASELNQMEPFFPLTVYVCDECFLVQLQEYVSPEDIFRDYAYFSSYSESWLRHAKAYVDMMTDRFSLRGDSLVVELASNDGYLLQYFVEKKIPVLGIEPARNVAQVAIDKGVPSLTEFFGKELATKLRDEGKRADVIAGNNVLAQVPDINDFVGGVPILLADDGVLTFEFPHLEKLMEENQFDTIYHEHFSYFSLYTVEKILAKHGLRLFDVQELPSHGGSLRIFACHDGCAKHPTQEAVSALRTREIEGGVDRVETYRSFSDQVMETKRRILSFLIQARDDGKKVIGYGAPGKGNTLLNYCGIRSDLIEFTVDRNPHKHGKFCPGTHIPIHAPEALDEARPDFVFILPWNLKREIINQLAGIREWGGRFVVPIPEIQVID